MYCSLSQSKQYVCGVLCIGDHHGSSATLLCLSISNIFIFDPHSVSMRGEPVSNGTSALLHLFLRTNMIQYLHTKCNPNLSLIFNISIVHCTQTNQSIVNYFQDQRYQSFKSKNVDSKYEQNVQYKEMKKTHANIYSKYSRKMVHQNKRKEYQKYYYERKKGNTKSEIKERRKSKYKSQTKQGDDPINRQKRNCKKIDAKRKIGRKLKSKQLADIHCNTQITNVECAKVNGTQNGNIKKCNIFQQRYRSHSSNLYEWQMWNMKLHPSTLWTLRTKMKLLEQIKKMEEKKNRRKVLIVRTQLCVNSKQR